MATLKEFFESHTPNNTDIASHYAEYLDKEYLFIEYKWHPEYAEIHWALDIQDEIVYIYELPRMNWME